MPPPTPPPVTCACAYCAPGTTPARSQWREAGGGAAAARLAREDAWAWEAAEEAEDPPPRCPTGTQFAVPADDLYGYGDLPPVLVTDLLRVPAGLRGDFVLSWRWDCEQTDQVWSTCADVTIVA
ncbi:hypothetical protein EMIHUDRAFT_222071 [Emiliania huxleyi CCMP1516]|uniref:Chitin-binding type-4 domain-containing protein n=2 Tax=Emiliania huxleyi TaxID=2903 RepID=A0A0D3KZ37_EMIH1|nr:hypothetical protein EMIHUDRAFT_222071 [Emiliania huxleyi CCMP1516]EOD41022.1 hypothetical protein EMIHUDRAFT_222071 [Emiliania huxleyi CCMP1516]|eukprot:XP_005793451.1 hypothetical protein EMIHUDRAFT_222071 [Emiliania huxleyi CCMP1516]